jgi:hypothetical protein
MAGTMPDPWERQPRESGRAFVAFQLYRDQPPAQRSLRKLASQMGVRLDYVGRLSSKNRWVDRVSAWDAEQDRILRATMLEERKAMFKRLAATGALMQSKGITRIRGLVSRVDSDGRPIALQPGQEYIDVALSPLDATRLVEAGARLESIGRIVDPDDDTAVGGPGGTTNVTIVNNPILAQLAQRPEAVGETAIAMQRLAGLLGLDQPPTVPGNAVRVDRDDDDGD